MAWVDSAGRRVAIRFVSAPIIAYRRWVSPVIPARCRFYPSCSEYALTAVTTRGPLIGIGLAAWRLLRCQPLHPGGFDPVPPSRRQRDRDDLSGVVA